MSEMSNNTDGLISFDEVLEISQVASYYDQFSHLLNEKKAIIINAENIERIDGAGLQLLCAFFKEAESLGIALQWEKCSEVFKKSAQLSGLSRCLGLE